MQPTAFDEGATANFVLVDQYEYHVTFHHKFDSIVFNVEFMHWRTDWLQDPVPPDATMPNVLRPAPKQDLNFMGAGINYLW